MGNMTAAMQRTSLRQSHPTTLSRRKQHAIRVIQARLPGRPSNTRIPPALTTPAITAPGESRPALSVTTTHRQTRIFRRSPLRPTVRPVPPVMRRREEISMAIRCLRDSTVAAIQGATESAAVAFSSIDFCCWIGPRLGKSSAGWASLQRAGLLDAWHRIRLLRRPILPMTFPAHARQANERHCSRCAGLAWRNDAIPFRMDPGSGPGP